MIKTLLSLLFVLIVMNAVGRIGFAVWDYYQLKDEAERQIVFGARSTTDQIRDRILAKAEELEVPIEAADLYVHREDQRTYVDAYYVQPVEVFPQLTYPMELSFSVDAFTVEGATPVR